jgi:hypothetical protein
MEHCDVDGTTLLSRRPFRSRPTTKSRRRRRSGARSRLTPPPTVADLGSC